MDRNNYREVIGDVVCQVMEQTAFLFPEPFHPEEKIGFDEFKFVSAKISFSGDQMGLLMLVVPVDFCAELAGNMLGEDTGRADPNERNMDALKEILNIIAGQLLTRVYGDEAVFNIAPPEASELMPEEFFRLISANDYTCCKSEDSPIFVFLNPQERPHEHTRAGS